MSDLQKDFEDKIDVAADGFARAVDGLATRTYVREGVLKQAVVSVIWALFREMPDEREALAEVLDDWPTIIREADAQDRAKSQA